ncbi:MAG: inositol monophosphatase family protein [Chromatiaceae bacterium]|jgi:myo-inositol-1(or 4)-monophosphatase|nr:inositol monophosphatase family protein [Chromatiaceae bacterium]
MTPELDTLSRILSEAAREEILPRFRQVASRAKADGSLVTDADLAVQARVIQELDRTFPGIPVLGEEMPAAEQERLLAEAPTGVWCLDPLDGTSNFAGGFPYFSVSVALLDGARVVRGAIVDPVRGECFAAELGGGAYLDGQPLRLADTRTELRDCLALVDLKRLPPADAARMGGDAPFRSQRNLGSVALDWCWLAAGRGQLYLHGGQKLWDHAAGRLIASEAGASSRLFAPGGIEVSERLALAPRMAVAAASAGLFAHWIAWLGLPRPLPAAPAR